MNKTPCISSSTSSVVYNSQQWLGRRAVLSTFAYTSGPAPVSGGQQIETRPSLPTRLDMSKEGRTLVLYHYPCPDGIFAALAVALHFQQVRQQQVHFVPNRVFAPCTTGELALQVLILKLSCEDLRDLSGLCESSLYIMVHHFIPAALPAGNRPSVSPGLCGAHRLWPRAGSLGKEVRGCTLQVNSQLLELLA